jgi:hypothetical protein
MRKKTILSSATTPSGAPLEAADPIFAAIARYHAAAGRSPGLGSMKSDASSNNRYDDFFAKATTADRDALDVCHNAMDKAIDAVRGTVPTTVAGVRAGLEFFDSAFHRSLLKSPILSA